MRRGFSLLEVLTVTALLFIIATAMTVSVSHARTRARLSKAQSEMASIVAEVGSSKNPEEAARRYSVEKVLDPWGNRYRVKLKRRRVEGGDSSARGTFTVWYPNAFSPRGGVR